MDAVFIQHALLEDKLLPAPKKAKKIIFTDPFIYHSIRFWLTNNEDASPEPIIPTLVEACVVSHYRRFYPTYYIKSEGEVGIAYIKHKKFWPIEIKWTNQLRPKDLKQISKYNNGMIFTKSETAGSIFATPTYPLSLALYEMDQKH
jgi:predicted AAA+ superfamily ATPase